MLNKQPLVSIIIPTYNRVEIIQDTIASILNQTLEDWECIIIDDGSKDNSFNILKDKYVKYTNISFYRRPISSTKGPNSCRNIGLEKAKGRFVKFLDSDDLLKREALEKQVKQIGDSDVSVCMLDKVDFKKNISLGSNIIKSNNNLILDYLVGAVSFYVSGPLWSKRFLEDYSLKFDETIYNLDDWDFNLRAIYCNPKIKYLNEALVIYRIHQDSLSHEISKFNFDEISSEINARGKHLDILKNKNDSAYDVLLQFIKSRLLFFLRTALVQKNKNAFKLYKSLLKLELLSNNFLSIIKISFAYVTYTFFGKGYKLLS